MFATSRAWRLDLPSKSDGMAKQILQKICQRYACFSSDLIMVVMVVVVVAGVVVVVLVVVVVV